MSTNSTLPSIGYKRILYVTDLSESGRNAFPHAASIARQFDSELTVFHVVDPGKLETLLGYANEELWETLTRQSIEQARETLYSRKRDNVAILDSIREQCDEQLNKHSENSLLSYDVKVEMGEPLEKILEEAHSGNYDILVISKHGHRFSVKDAVMGDTARRVVRRCQIPVLVVPLAE